MTESNFHPDEAFDFSLEAGEFRAHLWQQLKDMMNSSIQELDDDDLEFLNAAGSPFSMELPEDDEL